MTKQELDNLESLIQEGEILALQGGKVRDGYNSTLQPQYGSWRMRCIAAIEVLGKAGSALLKEIEADKRGSYYYQMTAQRVLGCIRAAKDIAVRNGGKSLNDPNPIDALATIRQVCSRFHSVARQIRQRYGGRPTLDVTDEYDVQDLLHALLRVHFDDIRAEEWTPSYASKSARVDFLLKREQTVIEVKKTRQGLGSKEVGDQLIIDARRYRAHSDCKTLVCFIYDPDGRISNPDGLQADLTEDGQEFRVRVIICPKAH